MNRGHEVMGKSYAELVVENDMLRREIKVAREAAQITADFVVKQFEQTEKMLSRFQIADAERQAVLDAAIQLSIIATDIDGKIRLFSRGAANLLGYRAEDMVGKVNILSLHLPDELEDYGSKVSGIVESSLSGMEVFGQYVKQKRTRGREWLYLCKNGMLLQVNLSITGLYDPEGRMTGYLFTAMDLSAYKQLEFELMKAKDVAESANASKGDFLARMSHEIRTPMNGIIGMAHLLQKTNLDQQQRNYAEKVLGSANTLLRLINDILDFSKIDAGKLKLESIPFNLEDVLSNITNVIGLQTEAKGLEFLFHVEPQVPQSLIGDPLRLGQVLLNLAGNAVKFTHQGEIVIAVSVEENDNKSVALKFTVRDSGIGLYPEQVNNLFKAFSQADDSVTRKYGGTGLGLAICKQLTEMMGGQIWVLSEPGQGSDFIFTARFRKNVKAPMTIQGLPLAFQGKRALVVDDNQAARTILVSLLASLQMEVDSVDNGLSAIARLEHAVRIGNPYDIVILDWIMPGIDGIETARRIKADSTLATIPAMLMVTANGREDAYLEAEKVGMDAFLLKPVYGSVIFNTLLQVLGMEPTTEKQPADDDSESVRELDTLRGAHILLVDDNAINQEVGTAFLKDAGMIVEVAANGEECLQMLAEKPFDLVLMDIQMPVMDGLEATRRIRKNNRYDDLPIIAMTAHAMAGDREKSLAAGMNDHINKPIDPPVLHKALKKWLKEPQVPHPPPAEKHSLPGHDSPQTVIPQLTGIDSKEALRRLNNNSALFLKMLDDFQESFAATPAALQSLAAIGEWQKIQETAHTIKGVASYIGATALFQAAGQLEKDLIDGNRESATGKLPLFVDTLDGILSALNVLPEQPKPLQPPLEETVEKGYEHTAVVEKNLKLIDLLLHGELAAEECFEEMQEMLRGYGLDHLVSDIGDRIDAIDYEEAAGIAQRLLRELGRELG